MLMILGKISDKTYLRARKRLPGNSLVGGAQTSKGALTVQKARMLHCYQLQWLPRNSSCNKNNGLDKFIFFQNIDIILNYSWVYCKNMFSP